MQNEFQISASTEQAKTFYSSRVNITKYVVLNANIEFEMKTLTIVIRIGVYYLCPDRLSCRIHGMSLKGCVGSND